MNVLIKITIVLSLLCYALVPAAAGEGVTAATESKATSNTTSTTVCSPQFINGKPVLAGDVDDDGLADRSCGECTVGGQLFVVPPPTSLQVDFKMSLSIDENCKYLDAVSDLDLRAYLIRSCKKNYDILHEAVATSGLCIDQTEAVVKHDKPASNETMYTLQAENVNLRKEMEEMTKHHAAEMNELKSTYAIATHEQWKVVEKVQEDLSKELQENSKLRADMQQLGTNHTIAMEILTNSCAGEKDKILIQCEEEKETEWRNTTDLCNASWGTIVDKLESDLNKCTGALSDALQSLRVKSNESFTFKSFFTSALSLFRFEGQHTADAKMGEEVSLSDAEAVPIETNDERKEVGALLDKCLFSKDELYERLKTANEKASSFDACELRFKAWVKEWEEAFENVYPHVMSFVNFLNKKGQETSLVAAGN